MLVAARWNYAIAADEISAPIVRIFMFSNCVVDAAAFPDALSGVYFEQA